MGHYARLFGFSTVATLAAIIVGSAQAVTIATVPVGYAGNAPDPASGSLYGAVPYNYRIGTYDITNSQYVEFLNAKASASDPYGLWNSHMDPSSFEGAIARSGSGPFTYSVKTGYANRPVIYVSWYDANRFVNWLQNGQGNGDTESGTYLISGGGTNSESVVVPDESQRMTWAATNAFHWLLPSESEWYKAAYYNPGHGTYYAYPFQSNSAPAALAPPGNSNAGNFNDAAYNYDGSGSYLNDVGAYPNSLSPFGSLDMGGDVNQYNEALISGVYRAYRGSDWAAGSDLSGAVFRNFVFYFPESVPDTPSVGFRVASVGGVPEPSTVLLAALAFNVIWLCPKRFKLSAG